MKKILFFTLFIYSFLNLGFAKSNVWGLKNIDIISREEWGANETWKYANRQEYKQILNNRKSYIDYLNNLKNHKPDRYNNFLQIIKKSKNYEQFQNSIIRSVFRNSLKNLSFQTFKNKARNIYMTQNHLDTYKLDKVQKKQNGHELRRPLKYKYNKKKIIVHHTANDYNEFQNQSATEDFLRNIYKMHALTKGWGDIGYNFVIDQYGNIYEGKDGGQGVVGGHAQYNNNESIGIALIGDFSNQKPTDKQLNALIELSSGLASKYDIHPWTKKTYYKNTRDYPYIYDKKDYSIVGHRDVWSTSCPGYFLYSRLDYLRNQVSKKMKNYKFISSKGGIYKKTINIDDKKIVFGGNKKIEVDTDLPSERIKTCKSGNKSVDLNECHYQNGNLIFETEYKDYKASGKTDFVVEGENYKYIYKVNMVRLRDLEYFAQKRKNQYEANHFIQKASYKSEKIQDKINLYEVQQALEKRVKVLLYELSMNYDRYNIRCDKKCVASIDGIKLNGVKNIRVVEKNDQLEMNIDGNRHVGQEINIVGKPSGHIEFQNYDRKSYVGIPRNVFDGSIVIKKDWIKPIGQKKRKGWAIINLVSFDNYMKGIAEMNDQQHMEKIKAMSLIIRTYVMFYLAGENSHPSIPSQAKYNVIDDPRMFQKYVGAGYEKTVDSWPKALEKTKNKILMYNGYVPILPYFNCSPGFTLGAKEKYGWTDTPYLRSKVDLAKCDDGQFNGHGVGLSGKGAQYLAERGMDYKFILKWFYGGLDIKEIR